MRLKFSCQRVDGIKVTGHHGQAGGVVCGNFDPGWQTGCDDIGCGAHGQHGPRALLEHRLAPSNDSGEGCFQAHHARPACRRVFANAVADHGGRANTQAVEPGSQGVGHAEQGWLRVASLRQQGAHVGVFRISVSQPGQQVRWALFSRCQQGRRDGKAAVQCFAESRQLFVQAARHAWVL